MADELPTFGSEYAKSDRSQCKLCKSCISQGSLRLAIYVQVTNQISPRINENILFPNDIISSRLFSMEKCPNGIILLAFSKKPKE